MRGWSRLVGEYGLYLAGGKVNGCWNKLITVVIKSQYLSEVDSTSRKGRF